MSYQRTIYDARPPHEIERLRSSWDSLQRPHYTTMASPSHHHMPGPSLFDPESESSDISDTPGDDPQTRIYSNFPTSLPPPPPRHTLESLDAVEGRLRELQHIEDLNIKKQDHLKAKRARKDDRIRRKREEQDVKIKAIMDARARRDDRINRRRKMEDDAFERFDQELEEEENSLRRRQKRLKRGLPVEDVPAGSRISSASMSPPGPGYSNVPPPAKRHQPGPPGQMNSPVVSTPRPASHVPPSAPNSAGPNPPPYAFLQSSVHHHHPPPPPPPPPSVPVPPYGRSPTISHSPTNAPGAFQPIPRSHQPPSETNPYGVNGHPSSPHVSRPQIPSPSAILNTAPPPRPQPSSTYDTRPPPPTATPGFASINTPPASGFAPINPRSTATPPTQMGISVVKNADHERSNGHVRPFPSEVTSTAGSAPTSSKRTPSTTHPYQMSEAFANRHHHCERTDHLNRGIWTAYGPGGTKEMPTGPAQEMYLRCNHDGCRRIDWRTVHGLQCHIVKNHEQPKGTIGSLEKALDRYGVPVAEVTNYEREYGEGTGGTMADPKNLKLKTKSSQTAGERTDMPRRPYGTQQGPDIYKQKLAVSFGNSPQSYHGSPASQRSVGPEGTEDSETESKGTPINPGANVTSSTSKFAAVNGVWSSTPTSKPAESGDQVMTEAPASPPTSAPHNHSMRRDAHFWNMWPTKSEGEKTGTVPYTAHVTNPGAGLSYGPPPSDSVQPPTEDTPGHNRSHFAAIASTTTANLPNSAIKRSESVPKPEQFPPLEQNKEDSAFSTNATASGHPPNSTPAQIDTVEDVHATEHTRREPDHTPSAVQVQDKELVSTQETPKEADFPNGEVVEANRSETRLPLNTTRRASIVGIRRGNSRRASVAANQYEKEYEREQEEPMGSAEVDVEAEAEADTKNKFEPGLEPEKEKSDKEDTHRTTDMAQIQDGGREGERGREDGDDGDTITAAPPSPAPKDKEKDREREKEKDIKTTPRRMTNGRVLRKNR